MNLVKEALANREEIRLNYLVLRDLAFTDCDHLKEKQQQLYMKELELLSQNTITGHQALVRMIEMKKNAVTEPMDVERLEHYRFLQLLRQLRVKYFYDNDLVA